MSLLDLLLDPLTARYERTPGDRRRDCAVRRLSKESRRAPRRLTQMEHEVLRLRTLVSPDELRDLRTHYRRKAAA